MIKKSLLPLIAGLLLLVVGGYMTFAGGPPAADSVLAEKCRQAMASRGGDAEMASACDEAAFASAITATDAQSAAANISAANQSEIGGNMLGMFLLGLGIVLTLAGAKRAFGSGQSAD